MMAQPSYTLRSLPKGFFLRNERLTVNPIPDSTVATAPCPFAPNPPALVGTSLMGFTPWPARKVKGAD
jgi:hypothetical protein